MNLIYRAYTFPGRSAIISDGKEYTYQQLLDASCDVALELLQGIPDLNQARVAFMINPGFDYVKIQWGIWRAGGVAVPLHPGSPVEAVNYVLEDSMADILVVDDEYFGKFEGARIRLVRNGTFVGKDQILPEIDQDRNAMILYTSGTTGSPKGVVSTHDTIEAQVRTLVEAWEWNRKDHILNFLPMHHVHGIINILSCALWSGAICEFLPKFDPDAVFNRLNSGEITLFMAVPTIYHKLISHWETFSEMEKEEVYLKLNQLRLMVSGSAALPVSVMEKWEEISGQVLLERYGMTEIGMAISNPYRGERKAGYIGQPLPGVEIKLVDELCHEVLEGEQGEILVKGRNVFKEYWNRPQSTADAFTPDKWFKTGDIAIYKSGSYKIAGRRSVDIIKSGGYKISALEIEEVLRTRPEIKDCGVVGIPDEEWGELVCAALVRGNDTVNTEEIDQWIRLKLPGYKVPRRYMIMEELPRNAMGKVTKKAIKETFKDLNT